MDAVSRRSRWREDPRLSTRTMVKGKSKPLIPPPAICGCDTDARGQLLSFTFSGKAAPCPAATSPQSPSGVAEVGGTLCREEKKEGTCALEWLPVKTLLTRPDS